jgi:glyoxylase-like metal-dependent hydrolase (beta-lactamase superfamily II)
MKFGELEFQILTDGNFRLDGGAMFGVIPKPMWERVAPADQRNRITLAMNSLLIRTGGKIILVETGAGDKWDAKRRDIYAFEGKRLPEQLAEHGVEPEDVDIVVNTHLHFDHCGWNTRVVDGKVVPTFPNARYVVHRGQFDHARHPTERDQASYFAENYEPIAAGDRWDLVSSQSDFNVVPGVDLMATTGHTTDMMCVRLSGSGQTAVFLADLVPTAAHLGLPWIMGFDLYPMMTLDAKKKWLPEIAREGWLAIFGHDTKMPAARLRQEGGKITAEALIVD